MDCGICSANLDERGHYPYCPMVQPPDPDVGDPVEILRTQTRWLRTQANDARDLARRLGAQASALDVIIRRMTQGQLVIPTKEGD